MSTLLMAGAPVVAPTTLTQDDHLGLGEAIVFGVATLVTMIYGIGVLTAKRAMNIAINTAGIVISPAVLYIVNESPPMDITQVMVYTGAVMALALFVIVLVGVGDGEPVGAAGTVMRRPVLILLRLGLVGALTAVVWYLTLPKSAGLKNGAKAAPDLLTVTLYHDRVITVELTAILPIVAAADTLTLAHRQYIRARLSQRAVATGKMQDYAAKGVHPGQKPMPDVYTSTNSATAPVPDTQGKTAEESVPRALRARDQGLELSDASPKMGLTQRLGTIIPHLVGVGQIGRIDGLRDVRRSGIPSTPGAATPIIKQPVLGDGRATDLAAPKQREKK